MSCRTAGTLPARVFADDLADAPAEPRQQALERPVSAEEGEIVVPHEVREVPVAELYRPFETLGASFLREVRQ